VEIKTITTKEFQEGNAKGKRRISDKEATRIACAMISTHIQLNWPDDVIEEWMQTFHHTDAKSKNGMKILRAMNKILIGLQRKGRRPE